MDAYNPTYWNTLRNVTWDQAEDLRPDEINLIAMNSDDGTEFVVAYSILKSI